MTPWTAAAGMGAARRRNAAAVFPSRLAASGRKIVDANGVDVGVLRGFNVHAIADFAQTHFDDIAALGGKLIRVIVRWDDFEGTSGTLTGLSGDTNGQGGTATGAMLALDHTIARAAAAGLYVMLDLHLIGGGYPSWTSAQAAGEQKFNVYGQSWVQKLANRYGAPASSKYAVNVVGMGPNELPVDDATTRNGNASIPYLEAINRTWIGWMRTYAPAWIGFVCLGYAAQTPLKVTGTNPSYTEASTTAYAAVGGNVVLDLHDYMMGDTATSPPYDGRQFNGMLYPTYQGGHELGAGDLADYAPSALTAAQLAAYVAPYKSYSIAAGIPLMIGEWGWPIVNGALVYTAGEQQWIDDKQAVWDDAGAAARLQWNYDVTGNFTTNPFTARPNGHWRPSVVDEIGRAGGLVLDDRLAGASAGAIATRAGWSSLTGFTGWQVTTAPDLYCNAAEAWALHSAVPATVEYEVSARIHVVSVGATSVVAVALGIPNVSTRTAYLMTYEAPSGNSRLLKIVGGGAPTVLASFALGTPTLDDVVPITIQRSASGWISGFLAGEAMFMVQDTAISAKGSGGVYATGAVSASTGLHVTQVQISDVALEV